jgi:hypothetical protein
MFPHVTAGFLLGLFLYPEDGSGMFLRNSGLSPNYMALQYRRFFNIEYSFVITILQP